MPSDPQPTTADVIEAEAILRDNAHIRRTGTTEEVDKLLNNPGAIDDARRATDVLKRAKEHGVREIIIPESTDRAKGGLIKKKKKMRHGGVHTKRPQMMGGGAFKGKYHSYAAGGKVVDMKLGK